MHPPTTSGQTIHATEHEVTPQLDLAGSGRGQEPSIGWQDFDRDNASAEQQRSIHAFHYNRSNDAQNGEALSSADAKKPTTSRPPLIPRASSIGRRLSFVDEEDASSAPSLQSENAKAKPVTWRDLPNKRQLAILTLARLSEPITQTSLRAYMFYQLKSFDPSLPDSTIASQAGFLEGSFAASQFLTAMLWGRAADSDWCGRKRALLIGLSGTCLSCVGFGFSRSFWQAIMFRAMGGALNGNVGVMRTMISEIIKEKKYPIQDIVKPRG